MEDLQLELSSNTFTPIHDRRPKLEIPPPVRLIAIDQCQLSTLAGLETELDAFYGKLLGLVRMPIEHEIVYQAENARLRFIVLERPPTRQDFRPLGISVPSLLDLIQKLTDAEIKFEYQRGISAGMDHLLLGDPARNLIEISEYQHSI